MKLVAACKGLLVVFIQHILHHGVVLVSAKDQAEGWVIIGPRHLAIIIVNVKLHLSKISMSQFLDFEIDDYVTLQARVIENKIRIKVIPCQCDSALPTNEREAAAEILAGWK